VWEGEIWSNESFTSPGNDDVAEALTRNGVRRTREEIRTRVKELEPLVNEQERIRRALEALEASAQAPSQAGSALAGEGTGPRPQGGRGEESADNNYSSC